MTATIESSPPPTPSSLAVEFNVEMRPGDLYRANRAIAWRQLRGFLAICAGFVLFRAFFQQSLSLLIFVAVIGLICFAIHSAFVYLGARSSLRSNMVLSSRRHYSLSPAGLRVRSQSYWSDQSWGNIHELLETPHLLILRTSSAQSHVLPRRCLSAGEAGQIRNFFSQREALREMYVRGEHPDVVPLTTATVRMTAEDLYWGFLTMLLRKSFWYAGQLAFSFVLIFLLNPRFLSPLTFAAVGAIFSLYISVAMYMASSRAVRTNAAYQSEIQFMIYEKGLESSGPTFAFHHDWQNFHSVIETSRAFIFCPSSSQMLILPKRALTEGSKIDALRLVLKSHYRGKLSLKS